MSVLESCTATAFVKESRDSVWGDRWDVRLSNGDTYRSITPENLSMIAMQLGWHLVPELGS